MDLTFLTLVIHFAPGKSIESVEHYLLHCPNHARYRTVLFENLNSRKENLNFFSVNIVTLLYGKKSFDNLTNKRIPESTYKISY